MSVVNQLTHYINFTNTFISFPHFFSKISKLFKGKERNIEGLFYKIKDEHMRTQGYLLGTMHFQEGQPVVLDQKIISSFKKAKILLVELEMHTTIPSDQHERAIENGCIDLELILKALRMSKKVVALEKENQQINATKSIPNFFDGANEIVRVIEKAKEELSELTIEEKAFLSYAKEVKAHWIQGDESFFETMRNSMPIELTDQRDVFLAEKIDFTLQNQIKPFVAIGTGHLIGKNSVVSYLQVKGWKIIKKDKTFKN